MSTRKLQQEVTGLAGGLNTEASVLNILPSEMMDGSVNVDILTDGSVRRRKGVDYIGQADSGGFTHQLRSSTKSNETSQESPAVAAVKLTAPNGSLVERLVVDLNNEFRIFELTNTALKNINSPKQTLTRGSDALDTQKFVNMQFAQSGDRLYFAGRDIKPGFLSVDTDNESLIATYIDVIIRDPAANKLNDRKKNTVDGDELWFECIEAHTSSATDEPGIGANFPQFWFQLEGEIPSSISAWATATDYKTVFIKRYNKRNVPTSGDTFPTTVEFFAGRVWWSGDPKFPNDILFSQVINDIDDVEQYHQFADPFFGDDPDLVSDDGGRLQLQGAGAVKRMIAVGTSLFIGSNTSLWQISGPSGVFKATDFLTSKVLNDGIDGPGTMVSFDQELMVFGQSSIWKSEISTNISSTDVGQAKFTNVGQDRIIGLYQNIPRRNKAAAQTIFNPGTNQVVYFYNKTRTTFDNSFNRNDQPGYVRHVLLFDTRERTESFATDTLSQLDQKRRVVGAFTHYEFADNALDSTPYIAAPFVTKDVPSQDETVIVTDSTGAQTVVDSDGVSFDTVVAAGDAEAKDVVHFLGLNRLNPSGDVINIEAMFGTFNTSQLTDWSSDSTTDVTYVSKIVLGVQTMGSSLLKKALLKLFFVFKKVESNVLDADGFDLTPGGAFLITGANFAVDSTSDKYSDPVSIYFPDRINYAVEGGATDGHDHTWYQHRVRGRGTAHQLTILNDSNKDFHLVGWTQQFYGKTN